MQLAILSLAHFQQMIDQFGDGVLACVVCPIQTIVNKPFFVWVKSRFTELVLKKIAKTWMTKAITILCISGDKPVNLLEGFLEYNSV